MKKILLITAIAAFTFTSCKKDRTCTCTVTQTSSTEDGVSQTFSSSPYTFTYKMTKVSKNGSQCFSHEETTTDTYTSGSATHTDVDVYKYDCKLE